MSLIGKSPRKKFSNNRSNPYSSSPTKAASSDDYKYFRPKHETLDATDAPFPSPDLRLARDDPYHHYLLRSGGYKGKTLTEVADEDDPSENRKNYCEWMDNTYYSTLPRNHVLRKALDQWRECERPSQTRAWSLPSLACAPARFKDGN
ncbi:hypothetical protein BDV96DRAFT_581046 [Lophiotrema nucula]|uniref:Uncharacterized protein n=1 Tax=Lophiotrema nucula TaxID=690887 RepID=A0A6A5YXY4_9PLEO|nr:hypothetical protein BDV96DRAFT_581046 [Lophiotrema nucula]